MEFKNVITRVEAYSIAEELYIEPGDVLLSINDAKVEDVFDYMFAIKDEYLEVLILKKNGEEWLLEIEKDEDEDLGLSFESGLMDDMRSCKNKCIFCFIDQLPKGMRETLYFKDDDSRLSFLSGNYVTLTNMLDRDFERLLFYKFSPINISVHTTNPELRTFMLNNKNAKNILEQIKRLADNGISMNFQIVLCKDVNDLEHLDKTIEDLASFAPMAKSLSIVPVGITKYRKNNALYPLEPFFKDDAKKVIEQVEKWQKKLKAEIGTRFVFLADEFYLKAGIDVPEYKHYEDFPQIENGVGMFSAFKHEFEKSLNEIRLVKKVSEKAVITGALAYDLIKHLASLANKRYNTTTEVFSVENNFFGEHITVSGLLTGKDIIASLKGKTLAQKILIPENALRKDEHVFLDDITLQDLERELGVEVVAVKLDGKDFLSKLLE
ncbi:MAG: DUF512 domain-containing protein [Defluviitaleaceae bacterium]|nr:DUF512 domain-containing protein [Defluviitaleaceae bacterium]